VSRFQTVTTNVNVEAKMLFFYKLAFYVHAYMATYFVTKISCFWISQSVLSDCARAGKSGAHLPVAENGGEGITLPFYFFNSEYLNPGISRTRIYHSADSYKLFFLSLPPFFFCFFFF
jgi:hypothetical protein